MKAKLSKQILIVLIILLFTGNILAQKKKFSTYLKASYVGGVGGLFIGTNGYVILTKFQKKSGYEAIAMGVGYMKLSPIFISVGSITGTVIKSNKKGRVLLGTVLLNSAGYALLHQKMMNSEWIYVGYISTIPLFTSSIAYWLDNKEEKNNKMVSNPISGFFYYSKSGFMSGISINF
jgi:hypothetical protein